MNRVLGITMLSLGWLGLIMVNELVNPGTAAMMLTLAFLCGSFAGLMAMVSRRVR